MFVFFNFLKNFRLLQLERKGTIFFHIFAKNKINNEAADKIQV